ncbi:MAG: threonine synthase [Boseongicola sp. SB0675_bin_26]|nr:threonine synthase [Boseongicola sp. SB0675_bin_26]
MKYVSTRGNAPELSFEDAMLTGLATDGGLYVPAEVPALEPREISMLHGKSYEDVAFAIMRPFVGDTFEEAEFRAVIKAAYAGFGHVSRAPLKQVGDGVWLLELFHGPTLAFKDFAMQLIGQMFQSVLRRRGESVTIVGATSGDTGSAAIEAFRGLDNVDVCILYPHGMVSEVQRRQMTTPAEANVRAFAVEGTFDDCQRHLKDMFANRPFREETRLAAVNSINWARVMAQVVYYFTSAVALGAPDRKVSFCVPTGNFGDIYAGEIARRMGLPIGRLAIATNQNDILHRALVSGEYRTGEVRPSISPSMDIQVSSNFERLLFDAYGRDADAVRSLMDELRSGNGFRIDDAALGGIGEGFASGRVSEEETMSRIRAVHDASGQLVCPHTAVGLEVADRLAEPRVPMIALATADPAKFPNAVERATGIRPPLPIRMADLYERPERVTQVANDLAELCRTIREGRAA